jgi:hypothetical protein
MSEQSAQLALLLLIPAACAIVGLTVGRLIRGHPIKVERERPRLALSTACLRDARSQALSTHTRFRCAFGAIYFCCLELAENQGRRTAGIEHPSRDVIRAGLSAINGTTEQLRTVELVAEWVVDASPSLPGVPINDARRLAERIHAITVSMLS